jgi:hypothetical protein
VRVYLHRAMNLKGETVSIPLRSDITNEPALSIWRREGLTLPKQIVAFREQIVGDRVAMVIQWRPEPKEKVEGEI